MICYKNINELITLKEASKKKGRRLEPSDLSIIKKGAIVFDQEKIIWLGKSANIPSNLSQVKAVDLAGHILMPGLVDSHTHLVFAGDRAFEYTMRLNGATYEEIYEAGGGILHSSQKTNKASDEELLSLARERILRIKAKGVTTVEIKSGYGLDYQEEKRLTLLIDQLKKEFQSQITIFNTYMAAHAIPKKFKDSNEYLSKVVIPLLEELAPLGIIDAVDIFHEKNYFTKKNVEDLFNKANELNIPKKIHADELNDNSGAHLACKYHCLSADHLLMTNDTGIKKLANSETVATLLPGTALFLGKELPPARKLLDQGAQVALATDFNPGSCHFNHLLQLARITGKSLQMNSAELIAAITLNAAQALGFKDRGHLDEGLKPDFSLFHTESLDKLLYSWDETNLLRNLPS